MRSRALGRDQRFVGGRSGALTVAAALARAAAAALDAGEVPQGTRLLQDALRNLGGRRPLRVVENSE